MLGTAERREYRVTANVAKRTQRRTAIVERALAAAAEPPPDEIGPFDTDWAEIDGKLVNTLTGELRPLPRVNPIFIQPAHFAQAA